MNRRRCITVITGLLFLFAIKSFSQDKATWEPVYLQVTGANTMNGIEANFQVGNCNNEDVVFIRFKNNNDYSVKLEWFDAVFTQELKWINKDEEVNKRSVVIPGKLEMTGTCINTDSPQLVVKLTDFISDKKNFKRFHTSQLTVNSTH